MAELIWDGKYRDNKRVAPVRIALPFQTVETVNESAQDRGRNLDLFASGKPTDWRNRLIWGDKKYILPSLLPEFGGKVNLIYIDPPFDTGTDFSFTTVIPETDLSLPKEPSLIEQKAYRDTWGAGLDSYLRWFYETVVLLRELLADDGSIYVHLDWHVGHYAKAVLDEVFGEKRFVNEIVWRRTAAHNDPGRFGNIHDVLFFYSKAEDYVWNPQFVAHSPESIAASFSYAEGPKGDVIRVKKDETCPKGYRQFQTVTLRSPHPRPNLRYEYKGYKPHPNGWSCNRQRMEQYDREGRLFFPSSKDGALRLKMYLDESPGVPLQDLWIDVKKLEASSLERLGYETQKPETLLHRIVRASSREGDLVLDCLIGSGTTAAVAEKLGRRWIACDLGRFAIHTTRKRLLGIPGVKPFVVQNLGKYERRAWMAAEFDSAEDRAAKEEAYRRFILQLFHAEPIAGLTWLHGVKAGRMVHVGAVDAPVTIADVKAIATEVWRAAANAKENAQAAVDILGWEFAFELNETAKQVAAEARVDVKFRKIPREVLEKRAVEQGDIQVRDFFELRALSTKVTKKKRAVTIELTDFILPAEDLPDEVAKAVKHWAQWIDYWAIDWNYRNDTFHNEWQTYRTRDEPQLKLSAQHEYKEAGRFTVAVKVIDILGNDTTKTLSIEVG